MNYRVCNIDQIEVTIDCDKCSDKEKQYLVKEVKKEVKKALNEVNQRIANQSSEVIEISEMNFCKE